MIATGDYLVTLFDLQTGQELHVFPGHIDQSWIFSLDFSPDGKLLASGSREIILWDVERQRELRTLPSVHRTGANQGPHKADGSFITSLAFTPDGRRLISAGDDHLIKVWDIETGTILRELNAHTAKVCSLSLSPDGRLLASGSIDGTMLIRFSHLVIWSGL